MTRMLYFLTRARVPDYQPTPPFFVHSQKAHSRKPCSLDSYRGIPICSGPGICVMSCRYTRFSETQYSPGRIDL